MKQYIFGLDIGGTTLKLGLFEKSGRMLHSTSIATDVSDSGSRILPMAADMIISVMASFGIDAAGVIGVGVGSPGLVTGDGVVRFAANLGWQNVDIPKELGGLLHLPVRAANDANAAALGEMWQGAGKGSSNMVLVTLGTGIGGGIIAEGKLLSGHGGAAGEIGHITVDFSETEPCACGKKGCLEQYASARGIARLAKKHLSLSDAGSPLRSAKNLSAKDVFDAYKDGDALAAEILTDFAEYLGRGLGTLAMTLDPEVFVLGGGVSKAGECLIDLVRPCYEKHVIAAARERQFRIASLGGDAGIFGAAALFREEAAE